MANKPMTPKPIDLDALEELIKNWRKDGLLVSKGEAEAILHEIKLARAAQHIANAIQGLAEYTGDEISNYHLFLHGESE